MPDSLQPQSNLSQLETAEIVRSFIAKVYGWMTVGLMSTALFAMLTIDSPALRSIAFSGGTRMLLIIAELGLVVWLTARVQKMSAATATIAFVAYTALTGITLSVVFLAYTASSIASTFFVTASTFGAMSVYGLMTKRDLTGMGHFMMMGLIGMIIASIVNLFMMNSTIYWVTTFIGVIVFIGLTAYDTQRIKALAETSLHGTETEQKGAIIGALILYLDFINLFLLLLRVLGKRK